MDDTRSDDLIRRNHACCGGKGTVRSHGNGGRIDHMRAQERMRALWYGSRVASRYPLMPGARGLILLDQITSRSIPAHRQTAPDCDGHGASLLSGQRHRGTPAWHQPHR